MLIFLLVIFAAQKEMHREKRDLQVKYIKA